MSSNTLSEPMSFKKMCDKFLILYNNKNSGSSYKAVKFITSEMTKFDSTKVIEMEKDRKHSEIYYNTDTKTAFLYMFVHYCKYCSYVLHIFFFTSRIFFLQFFPIFLAKGCKNRKPLSVDIQNRIGCVSTASKYIRNFFNYKEGEFKDYTLMFNTCKFIIDQSFFRFLFFIFYQLFLY